MKDIFSKQSDYYARFRPEYPEELYQTIFKETDRFNQAWDCATGNGQVARKLSLTFSKVEATDISENQISRAVRRPNIEYRISKAEKSPFPDQSFDLITVGQALHWFDFGRFFKEVERVGKRPFVFAAWTYSLIKINKDLDKILSKFYGDTLLKYWEPERRHVESGYDSIPFPFPEVQTFHFLYRNTWSPDQLLGYLNSWSSVVNFKNRRGIDPVDIFKKEMADIWTNGSFEVTFPITLKMAKIG
jgi:hypothetical protein